MAILDEFSKELAETKEHTTDLNNLKIKQVKIMGKYIHLLKLHNADESAIGTLKSKQAKLIMNIA